MSDKGFRFAMAALVAIYAALGWLLFADFFADQRANRLVCRTMMSAAHTNADTVAVLNHGTTTYTCARLLSAPLTPEAPDA